MVGFFRRSSKKAGQGEPADPDGLPIRSFPTDGYFVPVDDEDMLQYETYSESLFWESRDLGTLGRSKRATLADYRVSRGPTQEDRDNIPYIQEAWEWARHTCASLRMKPGDLRYGVVLDCLTRMRAMALIAKRNDVWQETAHRVAGCDFNRILTEHNAEPRDVQAKLKKVEEAIWANCRGDDWDEVVWGDIDPYDPARKLEIREGVCDGCGKCTEAYPDLFSMKANGKAAVLDPKAPRDSEKERRCLEAMELCAPWAILLNTRGTIDGLGTERGRPLPGQMNDAK